MHGHTTKTITIKKQPARVFFKFSEVFKGWSKLGVVVVLLVPLRLLLKKERIYDRDDAS